MNPSSRPSADSEEYLPEPLLRKVLEALEIERTLPVGMDLLKSVYEAWCRSIPFDNVRKVLHLASGNPAPLAGGSAVDFFEAWLRYRTGGTCWANAGATHALLTALGFDAVRGIGTMMAAPSLPPNHGTVLVRLEDEAYLIDGSIQCAEPLRLDENHPTEVTHPAWGLRCAMEEGRWHIDWRPLHKTDGFVCRLESFGASGEDFRKNYEHTRGWSPFNYQISARINRGNEVVGIAFGQAVSLLDDGRVATYPLTREQRDRILIEDIGIREELVTQLPEDVPTPPPPGSRTAAAHDAQEEESQKNS